MFTASVAVKLRDAGVAATQFIGYRDLSCESPLRALVGDGDTLLDRAATGQSVLLVCERSPFYAQGGGQVGDHGRIETPTGVALIKNTTGLDGFHLHQAEVQSGHLETGQMARLQVAADARQATERNHTATHLLHAALKKVLGYHVSQAGSEVNPDRLRFDYTQPEKPTADKLREVEELVNEQVLLAMDVDACVQKLDDARKHGFVALFGEKYGSEVRTLRVGEFSKELCGGTHVNNTGNIGVFRLVSETAVAAGTRRIEAVTGRVALRMARAERDQLAQVSGQLKVPTDQVPSRVQELADELKKTKKQLEKALAPYLDVELAKLAEAVVAHAGAHSVVYERAGLQTKDAQDLLHRAQQKFAPFAGVIVSASEDSVSVVVTVSKDLTAKIQAGDLVKELTGLLGGGGGGRPDAAQGKGKLVAKAGDAAAAAVAALQAAGLRS